MHKNKIAYLVIQVLMTLGLNLNAQSEVSYSFIVGGHTYGAHTGTNIGLHPNFLNALNGGIDSTVSFIVLTGDIVNISNSASWQQVEDELNTYALPSYYVMGNHDSNPTGIAIFNEKHEKTYYTFTNKHDLFIVLNSTETAMSISDAQIQFLNNKLMETDDSIKNVFIFFHELLWNSHEKYLGVKANNRSRYNDIKNYSNFWTEVYPILQDFTKKKFYVFAGDVGGRPDAIPAFFDVWENTTLVASGMGEIADENYLIADVYEDESVNFRLIPLNEEVTMNEIQYYSVPEPPTQLTGPLNVNTDDNAIIYTATDVFNAESYIWTLPENALGTSNTNTISIDFTNDFLSGDVLVQSYRESFGVSAATSLHVAANISSTEDNANRDDNLQVDVLYLDGSPKLRITSQSAEKLKIRIYNVNGSQLYSEYFISDGKFEKQINLNSLPKTIYFVHITGSNLTLTKKILLW
jgi:hypothetical protein